MELIALKLHIKPHQFWRPFNITITVNNSIEPSPFADHMTIRGANNGIVINQIYSYNY